MNRTILPNMQTAPT